MNEVEKRIEIGKDFVSMHKSPINQWTEYLQHPTMAETDDIYELIYYKLKDGVYGSVADIGNGEFETEISLFESKSGHFEIFNFEII
jgi:hypothetical protein